MGRYQAATAVAVIAAKGETIRSPGGYLRGMTSRAQNGELHLSNSLWGLARREEPVMRKYCSRDGSRRGSV
jgi:replication initiation protein RepC